jgi:hypothetical protein
VAATPTTGDNSNKVATTAFVATALGSPIQNVTGVSPVISSGGTTPAISLGTVPTANGGTGLTSPTVNNLLAGNGPNNALNQIAPSTAGNVLTSTSSTIATVTGSITGTALAVTAVGSGTLQIGATLSGTNVTSGTTISSQSNATGASSSATATYSSGGATSQATVVFSSVSGLLIGQFVSGTGLATDTYITTISGTTVTFSNNFTVQAAGTYTFYNAGGIGNYVVSTSSSATSTTITATLTSWASTAPTAQPIKAWANFDGTQSGTITPRASSNISTIVKNATGDYTITFSTALTDANYVVSGSAASNGGGASYANCVVVLANGTPQTASSFRIFTGYTGSNASSGGNADSTYVQFMVVR